MYYVDIKKVRKSNSIELMYKKKVKTTFSTILMSLKIRIFFDFFYVIN